MAQTFEHEERYRVDDAPAMRARLESAGFAVRKVEMQTDHWFIPGYIMSPEGQGTWFDDQLGAALRIREDRGGSDYNAIITTKRLQKPYDHTTMTVVEHDLTVDGMIAVLSSMGEEFESVVKELQASDDLARVIPFSEAKRRIEAAGRKEYITLDKQRLVFRHPAIHDVVVDVDTISALNATDLGFSSAIELEYIGTGSAAVAAHAVALARTRLGFNPAQQLTKALPGLAIPYLARF